MLYKDALEFDLAIESFLRALKVSPNDTIIMTNLAAAYSRYVCGLEMVLLGVLAVDNYTYSI